MYCGKCGIKNPEEASFCGCCGQPLEAYKSFAQAVNIDFGLGTGAIYNIQPEIASEYEKREKKPINKKLLGIVSAAALAVAAAVVVVFLILNANTTINLNQYVTIETSGYDGYGKAVPAIDWEKLKADYGEKLKYTGEPEAKALETTGVVSPVDTLSLNVSAELDRNSGLANGDEVTVSFTVNQETIEKLLKCNLEYTEQKKEISGLEDLTEVDPFEGLTIRLTGCSPYAEGQLFYSGETFSVTDFKADHLTNISNGDKVTVTLNEDVIDVYAELYGIVPSEKSAVYGDFELDEYLEKFSDIKSDYMSDFKSRVVNEYKNNVVLENGQSLTSIEPYKAFLYSEKTGGQYINHLILVAKAQVRNMYSYTDYYFFEDGAEIPSDIDETCESYWFTEYVDITVDKDGNLDTANMVSNPCKIGTTLDILLYEQKCDSFFLYGYENEADLYDELINPTKANFKGFEEISLN